jgi:hypothetical protein
MMKKRCSLVLSIVVISMFLCSESFAQDIAVSPDLTLHQEWSTSSALDPIKQQWRANADEIILTLPPYQQQLIDDAKLKLLIEQRIDSLQSLKVYFAADFDLIRTFYENEAAAGKLTLEDLEDVADNRGITERQEKLRLALNKIPSKFLNDANRAKLDAYITSGNFKGLIGTSTSGLSNISIQPIYVDPETYEVHDDKAVWVIISTYSTAFVPPPLQP